MHAVSKAIQGDFSVSRQFQLPSEVHSLSISTGSAIDYLVVNFWNAQTVEVYSVKGLLESTSDAFTDNILSRVNVGDYAAFTALDIDKVHVFSLFGNSYLIVALSNGYVLGFNLYPDAVQSGTELQIVRLSTVFKCGNIVEVVNQPHKDAILLTSDSGSFLLSVD